MESSEISMSTTKVKGFSLKGEGSKKAINSNTLRQCVQALQQQQEIQMKCPQFGLRINPKNKKRNAQTINKKLQPQPVAKRFIRPDISPVKTFSYGVTNWENVNNDIIDDLYYRNISFRGSEAVSLK